MSKTPQSPQPVEDKPQTAKSLPHPCMYVGPPLRSPVPVGSGTVYSTGLPPALAQAVTENADLAALFVSLPDAGKALRGLEKGKGPLIASYTAVARAAGRK